MASEVSSYLFVDGDRHSARVLLEIAETRSVAGLQHHLSLHSGGLWGDCGEHAIEPVVRRKTLKGLLIGDRPCGCHRAQALQLVRQSNRASARDRWGRANGIDEMLRNFDGR